MNKKILILGSTGFVGRNIVECLENDFSIIKTSRQSELSNKGFIYFDLFNKESWQNIININPDIIINASAYGVVKLQQELELMYKTNYFLIREFHEYLIQNNCISFWLQIGTAFEYDLLTTAINEQTICLPKTHYGISKLMMSNFLQFKGKKNTYTILRPFGMFGKYEDTSKFFPSLINAQKTKTPIDLSPGTQARDYIYVKDLGEFIKNIVKKKKYCDLPATINIGRGEGISFKDYASILKVEIKDFNPSIWNWGKIGFRKDESDMFYSSSKLASSIGFVASPLKDAFKETVQYYNQFR